MAFLCTAQHGLVEIPSDISKLVNLRVLTLDINDSLNCISESISCLQSLEVLHIAGSILRSLPDGIAKLTKLTQLYINDTTQGPGLSIPANLEVMHQTHPILVPCLPVKSTAQQLISH